MYKISSTIIGLILCIGFVFAGITPSELQSLNVVGGSDYNQTLTISNEYNYPANVELYLTINNESKDFNGFNVSVSDNNFLLQPKETKIVLLKMNFALNILPEKYDINVTAKYLVNEPNQSSGGRSWTTNMIVDKNLVLDENKPIETIPTTENVNDSNKKIETIYIPKDENLEIIDLNDSTNPLTGLFGLNNSQLPLAGGILLVIVLGTIAFIFTKPKGRV